MLLYRLTELRDRVRQSGLRPVSALLWRAVRERVVPPWHLLYWIPCDTSKSVAMPEGALFLVVRDCARDLTDAQRSALSDAEGPAFFSVANQRIARGAVLHVLFQNGQVAGNLFVVPGRAQRFQHIALTEKDCMVLDARITPSFRGRGLYPVLLARTVEALHADGLERLYIDTAETNTASLRSYDKVGFRYLVRYRPGRRQRYQFSETPL